MTGPFRVDQETLALAASDVRSTRTEVDGQLKALQGNVEELGASWKGPASTGFASLMGR
jgi:WXG100 family type VII secretion target